jgi:hypothetical protein
MEYVWKLYVVYLFRSTLRIEIDHVQRTIRVLNIAWRGLIFRYIYVNTHSKHD